MTGLAALLMLGAAGLDAVLDQTAQCVEVRDGGVPVLRYDHGSTQPPAGIGAEYARGGYVSRLYGPSGELLTEDYPADHPHHRAVNWSWATIQWRGEQRDLFAVRGIWTRPQSLTVEETPEAAVIRAQSVWKWDDADNIVAETAAIRVYPAREDGRAVDFTITLEALTDGLEFAGRLDAGYSGFNVRMALGQDQQIVFHTGEMAPRRAWADYSAVFPGGDGRTGLAILQHASNPGFPQPWREYPALNFFQPVYPGGALIPLEKDAPVVLRYRLWIHPGGADADSLGRQWERYNGK